ncbi:MAG: glycoside hydrolase family 16 domain protein, partial [Daejeonella sp.]|nr:glycoside hydrolase family 16 domain protein [Daejeonella sp.]
KEWSPFEHKFYIILTAGVGGKDNQTYGGAIVPEATFPCATYIDWVRVYKRK